MRNEIYLVEPSFHPKNNDIFHGFFSRKGGRSIGEFVALNCGPASGEDINIVQYNRQLVAEISGVKTILSVHQVHGARVVSVTDIWSLTDRPKADAMVTDEPDIGLGILTADCGPVLLWGRKQDGSPVIGAAHAGWKGALSGVLENTVAAMTEMGALRSEIRACVGPCILKSSYEVRVEFIDPFIAENQESRRFFHAGLKEGYVFFDLSGYCAWRLFRSGLRKIVLVDQDTYAQQDLFYSYRRATHQGKCDYGRQISVIAIKKQQ